MVRSPYRAGRTGLVANRKTGDKPAPDRLSRGFALAGYRAIAHIAKRHLLSNLLLKRSNEEAIARQWTPRLSDWLTVNALHGLEPSQLGLATGR